MKTLDREKLIVKVKEFEKEFEVEAKKNVKNALEKLREFLGLYPYRENPEEIDLLTPEKIYNPGAGDYFFLWIEHKLKDLGSLRIGSALVWENARDNPEKLKELLKTTVDDNLTISQKIDSHWEDIKYFGGDRMIAKKILYCYYPDKCIPVFKTEDLEHFANQLGIDYRKETYESLGKSYEMLSIGQRFEHLNNLLLQFKNKEEETKNWDNLLFVHFLYDIFPPARPLVPPETLQPLHPLGLLFEPKYEQEVVYLFSVLHRDLDFPYVISMRSEFPDAIVIDKEGNVKKIEFEVRASGFSQHGHNKKGCDFIVCWENDLETSEDFPQIIQLKDFIKGL